MDKCPLCNKQAFKQGDDFKTLCNKHAFEVFTLLFESIFGEIFIKPMRDKVKG